MGEVFSVVMILAMVALTAIYLWIYHKLFHVVYFDLGKGCLNELLGAGFLACITVSLAGGIIIKVGGVIGGVLGFILKLIFLLLKVVVVIAIVAVIGYFVYTIVNNNKNISRKDKVNKTGSKNQESGQDKKENTAPEKSVTNCGKIICAVCGHEGNAGDTFCEECGNPIICENRKEADTGVEKSKDITNSEKNMCPVCGHKGDSDDIFCENCGNTLK
ncbi:MAG: zinc ribbon domain-containing protein [Clostridiales bacterium]|nr:zinc ribbon domain-containing protein [Clostridiales bacterium]